MFRKFLKDYFTFTRSERNGLIVLIAIIFILVAARIVIPHIRKNIVYDFSEFRDEITEFEKSVSEAVENPEKTGIPEKNPELFLFDPNTATAEDFQKLGLENRVIKNLLKYRERGGIFRERGDLKKIYGLDSSEYLRIEPFILIHLPEDKADSDTTGLFKTAYIENRKVPGIPLPLNISDSAALVGIYGIGPVLSARIIKYRNLLGGYIRKEQLLEVYGMSQENYENISDFVFIDSAAVFRINLNTTDINALDRHPYLNGYQARALISYREINGRFSNTEEIMKNNLLPEDVYLKIRPYLITE
jgi:competence protein ComEA